MSSGRVFMIGAGPGNPDLLTVRAARILREAELVFHDDLVSQEILDYISPTAHVQNVGKRCRTKCISQTEINELMIQGARAGYTVVRLKSGDPLIFGRAAEEVRALRQAHVPFEIVPGITSALAGAAALQVSLTERHVSSHVVFTTAHQVAGQRTGWAGLAKEDATFVIYMPGTDYAELKQQLTEAGISQDTPCAVLSSLSRKAQSAACTTVGELHEARELPAPTLVIVGEVCRSARVEELENLTASICDHPSTDGSSHSKILECLPEPFQAGLH